MLFKRARVMIWQECPFCGGVFLVWREEPPPLSPDDTIHGFLFATRDGGVPPATIRCGDCGYQPDHALLAFVFGHLLRRRGDALPPRPKGA